MLIEVKVKVTWIIADKVRKAIETFILDKEVFAQAEYEVTSQLNAYLDQGTVADYEILGLKLSTVKEIITQYEGEYSFIAALRDTFTQDDGTEKIIRYKILLWANNISDAMAHIREIARQGYDMQIDSLKEVKYTYLNILSNEIQNATEN